MITPALLNTDVAQMGIRPSAALSFHSAGIATARDVLRADKRSLLSLPKVGEGTLIHLREWLENRGVRFASPNHWVWDPLPGQELTEQVDPILVELRRIADALDRAYPPTKADR